MNTTKVSWPLVLFLAIIKFSLPLIFQHPLFELQRDEFLYYQQGLHPALGYLENPPMLSWLATVSSWAGGSEIAIKFWPCLFGAATVVLTCLITAEFGGKSLAQLLAALGVMGGAFVRIHALFQPNFLDVFFWTLSLYFLVRYVNTKQLNFIFLLAISLALGWWSKYSVLFMAASVVVGLALSPYRAVFVKKQTWLAAALALLLIAPNVVWQYHHNWPLMHHMAELRETQLQYINKADFIKDQLMMLLPGLLIWLAGLIWVLTQKRWYFIGIIYFSVILLLLFGSGKSYYTLGVYPVLFAAGGFAWEQLLRKRKWISYSIGVLMALFNWMIMPLLLPTETPGKLDALYKKIHEEHKWEDLKTHPLPQDFADMLGWKELSTKAEKIFYTNLPDTIRANTIIYCRHYGQAGSLKFYGKQDNFTSRVLSDNGSFLLWIPDNLSFRHILFIGRRMPGKDDEVFQHFGRIQLLDSVTNPYSRQFGDKIIFFENIDKEGLRLAQEGLKKMKQKFNR